MRLAVVAVVFVLVVVFWLLQQAWDRMDRRNTVIGQDLSPRRPDLPE